MKLGLGLGIDSGFNKPLLGATGTSYLLDTYTGAAAAYSLRQLRTGVTNVVRVRRSSDDAEADFTATEVTDGTLTTWTGANDGFVVTWYDQSETTTRNATQSTATGQPKIVNAGSLVTDNSLPAMSFDGGDGFDIPLSVIASSRLDTFCVMSESTNYVHIYGASSLEYSLVAQSGNTSAIIDKNYTRVSDYVNGTVQSWVNRGDAFTAVCSGSQILLTLFGTVDNNWTSLNAFDYASFEKSGKAQELIIWTSDQSSNRTAIETDINTHYSIY